MATIDPLPHWACVAFAGRCAEHVLSILDDVWPQCPAEHRGTFARAVRAAGQSAARGKLIADYPDVASAVTGLTGTLILRSRGILPLDAGCPATPEECRVASDIATVFAKSAEAALAKPGQSYEFAMDGFAWALEVAGDSRQMVDEMKRELQQLHTRVASERWDHRTCVDRAGTEWIGTKPPHAWWRFWEHH